MKPLSIHDIWEKILQLPFSRGKNKKGLKIWNTAYFTTKSEKNLQRNKNLASATHQSKPFISVQMRHELLPRLPHAVDALSHDVNRQAHTGGAICPPPLSLQGSSYRPRILVMERGKTVSQGTGKCHRSANCGSPSVLWLIITGFSYRYLSTVK